MKYILRTFESKRYMYFVGDEVTYFGGFGIHIRDATLFESEYSAKAALEFFRQIGMAVGIAEIIPKTDAEMFKIKLKG